MQSPSYLNLTICLKLLEIWWGDIVMTYFSNSNIVWLRWGIVTNTMMSIMVCLLINDDKTPWSAMYSVRANGSSGTALNWDVIDEMYVFYRVATILVSSCIIRGICSFQRLLMSGIHRFLIYSLLLLGKQNFSNGHLRDRMNLIKEKLFFPHWITFIGNCWKQSCF